MKRIALIIVSILCTATHGAETGAQLRTNALNIAAAPYLRLHQEFLMIHHELVLNLALVHDKESADKVAPSITELAARLHRMHEQEQKLPIPPAAMQTLLKKHTHDYQKLSQEGVGKALEMTYEPEQPCYGSILLEKALDELLREFCVAI